MTSTTFHQHPSRQVFGAQVPFHASLWNDDVHASLSTPLPPSPLTTFNPPARLQCPSIPPDMIPYSISQHLPAVSSRVSGLRGPARVVRHGLSGFGPRNAMLFKGTVLTVLAEREQLAKLGVRMEFHVFEKQSQANAGSGNAFQVDCDATMNTPITGPVPFANSHKIPAKYQHIVKVATDLAGLSAEALESTAVEHREELRKRNPAGYALFLQSRRKDGSVDVSTACTTRGTVGKIQRASINEVLDFVAKEVPEISIEFHYDHTVVDADFTRPTEPKLIVCNNSNGETTSYAFDFVHLANGTTWKVPVSDSVAPKAFSETPSLESVGEFLSQQGLLDTQGLLRRDTRLGITGISLSAYDPIAIILQYTRMIRTNDNGYEIDEEVAKQYRGLFTFISRSEGEVAPPRHHHSRAWPGKASFIDMDQAHAMFLQKDFDWLSFIRPLLYQNVSYEIGTTPSRIDRDMSTADRMSDYHRQTLQHEAGATTEIALLRAGYQALLDGFGFENSPDAANKQLLAKAPLTRDARAGWLMRRSAASDITRPDVAMVKSNSGFFRQWTKLQSTVAASPIAVQDMIAQLFALGVATHARGEFEEITYVEETNEIALRDRRFDAMFAPKTLTPTADVLFQALRGKVKEVVPGLPEYAKGRFLQTVSGTLIHATDLGSGGHGVPMQLADGSFSTVGMQWTDTNTHASGANWAANASRVLVLLSAMKASGCESPAEVLMDDYRQSLPTTEAFKAETASFEQAWIELAEKQSFLAVCEHIAAEDATAYHIYASNAFDRISREECLSNMEIQHPGSVALYRERLERIPAYRPVNRDEFVKRFADFTPAELENCWAAFFSRQEESARRHRKRISLDTTMRFAHPPSYRSPVTPTVRDA